ncbi:MAG: group II intron reverse transcriptase/maturase [Gammaproteobacteria bacterium]|nr:group II intron reverse transcriptase/maturase [Gammaproteobacteria bacterium]
METADYPMTTETKLKRIAWLSSKDETKKFDYLMHHFNVDSLRICYSELAGNKAVGVDGIDKISYGADLENNREVLVTKLRQMSYRPGPVRQVLISKVGKGAGKRELGISNFEDKLVQKMMHKVLESIYEPLFLDCSYGFRPGRSCHDAIRALRNHLNDQAVEIVIDIDLANFFGSLDQIALVEILSEKIGDKRFLCYISRLHKSGMLAEGVLKKYEEGVVQGSLCNPILSNIYAHYAIDKWMEETVKNHCRGKVELFRYCDDAVICCEHESDAHRIKQALSKRLAKYQLKLNEEKTSLVSFSKKGYQQGKKQGAFDFLGFTFYLEKSRSGTTLLAKVKSSGKRMRSKLKKFKRLVQSNQK